MTDFKSQMERLKRDNERLWLVLEASRMGLWDWDMTTGQVDVDDHWIDMLGLDHDQVRPFSIEKFMMMCHPADVDKVNKAIEDHAKFESDFYQVEIRLKGAQDQWFWIKSTGKIVKRSDDGEPLRMSGVHEDVSTLVRERIRGDIARSQLEAAQRLGGLGSWYLDLATDKVTWSEELFRMQGLTPDKEPPPASTHHQLFSPESWERLSKALTETIAHGTPYELELEMFNNGNFHGWMLARGEAIRSPEGAIVGVLGVALDITQRKSRETELRKKALLDPLSQLGNRTAFEISLAQTIKQANQSGSSFALIMLDIDHFKEINDQHGHDVGDRALVQVAERLRATLRGDDQIFRIGGDEFVVVLANPMPKEKLGEIAARLVLAFRTPILQLKKPLVATISAGLVSWNGREDSHDLLKRADEALYRAKSAGRNQLASDDL
ncbi:hypothetical protein AKACHI_11340 [Aquiluna sp. KACHI24]|nr:hypothetical protein AKACHI_11340 [Aquiluna sp. KACHI24]